MKNNKRRTPQIHKRRAVRRPERWDALLSGIVDLSRMLSYNLDADALWDVLHDHINLSFDATSFFVGMYDYERDQLSFPLISEEGLRIDHEPIPVCGLSRAIMTHGIEFYVQDVEAEQERLASMNAKPDEREPGRWARSWIGVPLRSRQSEVTGLIALQNALPNTFDDRDLSVLMTIAAPLSLALDNLRLLDMERERRLIAVALMEIGQLASAQRDYDDVLEHLLDQLQRVTSYDSAAILLTEIGTAQRLIVGASHDPDTLSKGAEYHFTEHSPLAQSLSSQQPIVVDENTSFATWWDGTAPVDSPLRSWLVVPLVVQEHANGLVLLGKLAPKGYTQKDASNAFALARQGAIALETARLQAQADSNLHVMQQRARRLASINRIASVIASSLDRDQVLRTAAQLLTELFEADHCSIVMLDLPADDAELTAEYPDYGHVGLHIVLVENATMDAIVTYATAVAVEDVDDTSVDTPTRDTMRAIGALSSLIAPLVVRDRVLGTIGIDQMSGRRRFTNEERETLVTIAGQVAMAVSNAELYEAALAANRLKSAFLANISHELRTPLNAILGYTDMLLDDFYGTLNHQQRDRLERVSTSSKHLLELIDDVLDLSKIEAGQIVLELTATRASAVLDELVKEMLPDAQAKGLTLVLDTGRHEPRVRADDYYLREIAMHLLKNAIKFTDQGGISLDLLPVMLAGGSAGDALAIPRQLDLPDGDYLAIRVVDTGVGIKPEDRDIIFETFRQGDSSTVREYGGTGLGLAITRRLVELHAGAIWVDSTVGKGSTFTLLLPTYEAEELVSGELADVTRDKRPLVLVIDDDPADRMLLRDYLGDDDYQTVGTANSVAALEIVRQLQPDLVITDVMMPEANGWDVLRELKADDSTAKIPVIVLSALDHKGRGLSLGAVEYLIKPVDRETLCAQVKQTLSPDAPLDSQRDS